MQQHKQMHLWITEADYGLLRRLAEERRETMSTVIRRLIKLYRILAAEPPPDFDPVRRPLNDLTPRRVLDQER
jgi:hypothetical protein